uniref:Protein DETOXIFICATION n=1 Tax=Oryza punctata TaxID=4537 RepID=A0A0E0JP44_ORYPU
MGFVTAAFVGHIGKVELAAVSVVNGVVEGLAFGLLVKNHASVVSTDVIGICLGRAIRTYPKSSPGDNGIIYLHGAVALDRFQLGMGSALETLCGQAVGAGQPRMLGVYLQRSWVICLATSLALLPLYLLASPVLRLLRQSAAISSVAGRYARWCAPQLFAYAVNFPMQKFYQAQSRVWVVTAISAAVLAAHALLNWLVVARLGHGVVSAALVGDVSWWLLNAAQLAYLVGGSFPEAWSGFSRKAFSSLGGFVKLSLASAVMLCLEMWYYTAVLILVGCLKNPEIQVGAISICMNYQLWTLMVAVGFNAAVSVRVANELGANHPTAAKFSVVVAVATSAAVGLVFTVVALVARKQLPRLFTGDDVLVRETAKLGLSLNATGIWVGMLIGTILQTVMLLVILFRTKWQKEVHFKIPKCFYTATVQAMLAEERIKVWGGGVELPTIQEGS